MYRIGLIFQSDIDSYLRQMVPIDVDILWSGSYRRCKHIIGEYIDNIGVIEIMCYHDPSDCVWYIVRTEHNTLVEVWTDD